MDGWLAEEVKPTQLAHFRFDELLCNLLIHILYTHIDRGSHLLNYLHSPKLAQTLHLVLGMHVLERSLERVRREGPSHSEGAPPHQLGIGFTCGSAKVNRVSLPKVLQQKNLDNKQLYQLCCTRHLMNALQPFFILANKKEVSVRYTILYHDHSLSCNTDMGGEKCAHKWIVSSESGGRRRNMRNPWEDNQKLNKKVGTKWYFKDNQYNKLKEIYIKDDYEDKGILTAEYKDKLNYKIKSKYTPTHTQRIGAQMDEHVEDEILKGN